MAYSHRPRIARRLIIWLSFINVNIIQIESTLQLLSTTRSPTFPWARSITHTYAFTWIPVFRYFRFGIAFRLYIKPILYSFFFFMMLILSWIFTTSYLQYYFIWVFGIYFEPMFNYKKTCSSQLEECSSDCHTWCVMVRGKVQITRQICSPSLSTRICSMISHKMPKHNELKESRHADRNRWKVYFIEVSRFRNAFFQFDMIYYS